MSTLLEVTRPAADTHDAPAVGAPPAGDAAVEITGYVEAATGNAVLGWAWTPRLPDVRVTVELQLDGRMVAQGLADMLREDLARNGIGDGHHAFSVTLPEAVRPRVAELRVVGRIGDGAPVPLGAPPRTDGLAERLDQVQRSIDMVVASQRVLHRNLQAALLKSAEAAPDLSAEASSAVNGRQIAALEIFIMRLDERLAALAPLAPARADGAASSVGGASAGPARLLVAGGLLVVLALAIFGLYRSLAG